MNNNEEVTRDECVAEEDQTLIIPKGYFVCKCDLDDNPPTCKIASETNFLEEKVLIVPLALAYYLKTHFCGSYKMRNLIENQTRRALQNEFKELLGI